MIQDLEWQQDILALAVVIVGWMDLVKTIGNGGWTGECWEEDCGEILEERWGEDEFCGDNEEWKFVCGITAVAEGKAGYGCIVLLSCRIQKESDPTDTDSDVEDGEENNSE